MRFLIRAVAALAVSTVAVGGAAHAAAPCSVERVSIKDYCDKYWPGENNRASHQRCIDKSVNAWGPNAKLCPDIKPRVN